MIQRRGSSVATGPVIIGPHHVQPYESGWVITDLGVPADEYHYYFRTRTEAVEFAREIEAVSRKRLNGRRTAQKAATPRRSSLASA